MTAVENVALPLTFDGRPKRLRTQRAENCLDMVGMQSYKDHTPAELSGGQQQRVAIARAWVTSPWIVLADEPTGNLDSKSANDIMELLKKLSVKSKRIVVLITHNPDYIKYADKVFYIRDGVITKVTGKSKSVKKSKPKATLEFLEIDPKIVRDLKKVGYKSAQDIISAKISDLIQVSGVNEVEAAKIQKAATKFLEGEETGDSGSTEGNEADEDLEGENSGSLTS